MAVATAAVVGMAATAATTTGSFIQAGKQRKLQRQAESEAEKAMAEAKKKLEVNYYESLGIQKEPYELQREALLTQGAMGIEAGREGDVRGATGVVGRVQMAQQEAQGQIRAAMGQELMDLAQMTAAEESRLRDVGVGLNLEEVAGAQEAAANAQEMAAQATQQGIEGAINFTDQLADVMPLYLKTQSTKQLGKLEKDATKQGLTGAQFQQQLADFAKKNPTFGSLSGVGDMNYNEFSGYLIKQDPGLLKRLRAAYNPYKIK
jgi:hypothetical protein